MDCNDDNNDHPAIMDELTNDFDSNRWFAISTKAEKQRNESAIKCLIGINSEMLATMIKLFIILEREKPNISSEERAEMMQSMNRMIIRSNACIEKLQRLE